MTTEWNGQGLPPAAQARMERGRAGGPPASLVSFLQTHPYFQPNPQLAAQGIISPSAINPVTQGYISNNLVPTSPNGTLTPNGPALDNRDEFRRPFQRRCTTPFLLTDLFL